MTPELAEEAVARLCCFFIGPVEYAIDLMRIDEILQPQRVTPLPHAPPWVAGVMNLRGALVPVVELRRRLQIEGPAPERIKPRWLVCLLGRRRVALIVEGVSGMMRVPRAGLQPVPPFVGHGLDPAVIGACGPADRTRLLLNIKVLLRQDRPEPA